MQLIIEDIFPSILNLSKDIRNEAAAYESN
jgi:hypothetical protein